MEMGKILSADVLDIIFDQRNKEYGAYDLRKHYQARLTKSLVITLLVVVLILLTYVLLGSMKPKTELQIAPPDIILTKVEPNEKIEVLPPPKAVTPPPAVKTIQFATPLIVTNPPENERPPEQTALETAVIGTINKDGKDFDGVEAPVAPATGVVDAPKKHDEDDGIFRIVEIESQYPGGMPAWGAFLYRNLTFPQDAVEEGVQGTVVVQFIVDKEGNVSDVTAISGPDALRKAAITVIKKSGKWTAAIQNGTKVKSYKTQPITFKLAE